LISDQTSENRSKEEENGKPRGESEEKALKETEQIHVIFCFNHWISSDE
jgi:hypothetical protein